MTLLVAVCVGTPQALTSSVRGDGHGPVWTSAIHKRPVEGAVHVGTTNLAGDAQADLKVHGGPDQAVLCYCAEHYAYWRAVLPDVDWQFGGFGENFTIDGQTEETVYLGDVYAVGDVRLEVTKPRAPCYKISRRYGLKALTGLVEETGYHGWYCRVLTEGTAAAGMPVELIARPHPTVSIRAMNDALGAPEDFPDIVEVIAGSRATTDGWRRKMRAAMHDITVR
jgi:MOSC domain-containing protein YiiM